MPRPIRKGEAADNDANCGIDSEEVGLDGLARPVEGVRRAAAPTMVKQAYDYLQMALVTLQITPGERIAIDQVARKLNISQTPVREALSKLEAKKLVVKTPNVGYRASPQMTRKEVRDLYTLRQLIEPYAARQAAGAMTARSVKILQAIGRAMSAIADGDPDAYSEFAAADDRLHGLIAALGGNRLVADVIEGLQAHIHIFRALHSTNAPSEAAAEHQLVIDALIAGDADAAERAMHNHLLRAHQRMDAALTRDGAPLS